MSERPKDLLFHLFSEILPPAVQKPPPKNQNPTCRAVKALNPRSHTHRPCKASDPHHPQGAAHRGELRRQQIPVGRSCLCSTLQEQSASQLLVCRLDLSLCLPAQTGIPVLSSHRCLEAAPPGTSRSEKAALEKTASFCQNPARSPAIQESKTFFKGTGKVKLFLFLPEALAFQVMLQN